MYFWLMWMKDNNSQDTLASLATWHANGKKKRQIGKIEGKIGNRISATENVASQIQT